MVTGAAPRWRSRDLYAAAHVAGDGAGGIDWDATLRFRHVLWGHGLGVAEAMDTAQRGGGLTWELARELVARTLVEARAAGGARVVCGATTDQLPADATPSLDAIAGAYEEQCAFVEEHGGRVVVMASRHLARAARTPDDYLAVYGRVLGALAQPAIVHWLGPAFDPALDGYWGGGLDAATETCLALLHEHRDRIAGIKLSLLDADRERDLRARLPEGVRMYTGDDFDYVDLIRGDGTHHSDALLGVLDPIAPVVPAAMAALDAGDADGFERVLGPTLPLGRHLFRTPTWAYKTGVVWLAYLNGHQERFAMLGGQESQRSPDHLLEALRLAEAAGVLADPEAARARADRALAAIEATR